jgi:hypothetical protein
MLDEKNAAAGNQLHYHRRFTMRSKLIPFGCDELSGAPSPGRQSAR